MLMKKKERREKYAKSRENDHSNNVISVDCGDIYLMMKCVSVTKNHFLNRSVNDEK